MLLKKIFKSCFPVFLAAVVLISSGCFTTKHGGKKYTFPGTYKERALSDNKFEIAFTPKDPADTVKTRNLTLLRAATVAIKNGYSYFVVADQVLEKQLFVRKVTMRMTITCFVDVPQSAQSNVFDAKAIKNFIQNKYNLIDYTRF